MPRLHVCSLARLAAVAVETGAGSLLTLLSPGGVSARRPPGIAPERHLVIGISDIVAAREGFTHPEAAHVDAMLAFFRAWDRRAPLLIHCYAGVSRSTAAAFIGVCALSPSRGEAAIAAALRAASRTATPNARLVALADEKLGRAGRMSAAIAAIGRGADCFEGAPFALDLEERPPP
jgi:predicted protein tyrosine phosphatase